MSTYQLHYLHESKYVVGLKVLNKSGRLDYIFSSYNGEIANYKNMYSDASYALVGNEKNDDFVMFMGSGKLLSANGITILSKEKGNVVLEMKNGKLLLNNEVPVEITQGNKKKTFQVADLREIEINQ